MRAPSEPAGRPARTPTVLPVLLLALLVVALGGALTVVVTDPDRRPAGDTAVELLRRAATGDDAPGWRTADHRAAAEAAGRTVLAVLDVDHRDMQSRIDAVRATATGDLAGEYADGADRLARTAIRTRLVSSGELVSLGVAELSGDAAVVLVAADSVVTSTRTGGDERQRQHRMRLRLVRVDGQWLTEALELVR